MSGTKGCIVLSLMFVSITLDNEARLFGSTSLWSLCGQTLSLCPFSVPQHRLGPAWVLLGARGWAKATSGPLVTLCPLEEGLLFVT